METIIYLILVYILVFKLVPFVIYPNYLLGSKVENYPAMRRLSKRLTERTRLETFENVYRYVKKNYSGGSEGLNPRNWLELLNIGDFSTESMLRRKGFVWCHNQNRIMRSLLINTGKFKEEDIKVKYSFWQTKLLGKTRPSSYLWKWIATHQWLEIKLNGKMVFVDPFYRICDIRNS
ncbi:hypothetical protein CMI41_02265 [Candidatus Pacearchaeota archaeon]|jgi:hypothetical protein|nr:hypothetical protein [Candidatus Pacearchaeota archaeon]|tara:strand:+ start:4329 stop:4859 length:531 start_codon:yes stop_codon:yes gene_type:complete